MQPQTQPPASDPQSAAQSAIVCRRLPPSYGAVSFIMEFIVATSEFGDMHARTLFMGLKTQIQHGYHIAAYRNKKLVGYCGWLHTTDQIAQLWLKNEGKLQEVPAASSDAVALTIVRFTDGDAVLPAIRVCRQLNGERRVFFKRESRGDQPARKSSVYNS
jgi:hypothetical protein